MHHIDMEMQVSNNMKSKAVSDNLNLLGSKLWCIYNKWSITVSITVICISGGLELDLSLTGNVFPSTGYESRSCRKF